MNESLPQSRTRRLPRFSLSQSRARYLPRFSLLTAILLTTIVGLAIVVAQLWREVGPLRVEVHRYRTELGFLNVDDPTRIYAVQFPNRDDGWRWRVYLPPGSEYILRCDQGTISPSVGTSRQASFEEGSRGGITFDCTHFQEQTIVEARFK